MPRKKTRAVWMWDHEVAECFDLWKDNKHLVHGELCARYFEALRFRQQLTPGESFIYKASKIEEMSGLSYKRQLKARSVLEGSGFIEAKRVRNGKGTAISFRLTELAREATGHIPHKRDAKLLKLHFANLVKR